MCEVRVKRERGLRPGGATWFELPDELLFVVPEASVTDEGAASLEEAWRYFIDKGVWRWKEPGGQSIEVVYARVALPDGIAVRITSGPGLVCGHLSPEHFTVAAARGLQRVARECVNAGWAYHQPRPARPRLPRSVA